MTLFSTTRRMSTFDSIFPPKDYSTPTPQATPEIGSLATSGQPFGGFGQPSNAVDEALQTTRAWSTVTAALKERLNSDAVPSTEFNSALDLLSSQEHSRRSLRDWYMNEVTLRFSSSRSHYEALCRIWSTYMPYQATCRTMVEAAQAENVQTMQALVEEVNRCMLKPYLDGRSWSASSAHLLHVLQYGAYEKWTSLVGSLSFRKKLQDSLTTALYNTMVWSSSGNDLEYCDVSKECRCGMTLELFPLERLEMIGLDGEIAERGLATACLAFVNKYLVMRRCFRVDWKGRTSCSERLTDWVEFTLCPAVGDAIRRISHGTASVSHAQQEILAAAAVTSLGKSRTSAIFDYIKVWPHSEGAILDIKAYLDLKRMSDKAAVCAATDQQLQRRLLHAGASTAEVLGVYVNLINVFNRLDARGVLLEKVSPTIRGYLRGRSDAVNVLAESLFVIGHPSEIPMTDVELCRAISVEMEKATTAESGPERMVNWNDMQWQPDPVDAPPNHRSSWTYDVLTYMLSLFDHDDLIKEIESVLAKHLLITRDPEINRETRLLEHLKTRLDSSKLQNSEVMLKDVRDSVTFERRLREQASPLAVPTPKEIQAAIPAEGITVTELYSRFESRMKRTHFQAVLKLVATKRSDLLFPKRGRLPPDPDSKPSQPTHAPRASYRILSSSAWPQMQTADFNMPDVISRQMQVAEESFSRFSGQRKLQWRPALSKVTISLEFQDRVYQELDVPAWRAAVVNAFGDASGDAGITAEQLSQQLEMNDSLVNEALAYWLTKQVLYQRSAGVYAVLERLDMKTDFADPQPEVEAVQALKSQDLVLRENAPMFETFIENMLSNGGPKEVGGIMGITNMMKMVLPTFTYGDDEVRWLLGQMKSKKLVQEDDGDVWAVAIN